MLIDGIECACHYKEWLCKDLPECVTQKEWNDLYDVPRCTPVMQYTVRELEE